jgi:hypothetical protein
MATASILRIGPSENSLCANVLTNALISYFHRHQPTQDESSAANVAAASTNVESCLRLQNKYFTATVLLKGIENKVDDDNINNNNTNNTVSTATKEDGVILVFDAYQSNPDRDPIGDDGINTFDSLAASHEHAERNDTCGDLLRLCVGVCLGDYSLEELRGIKNSQKEYSRRILWCLDRGYEYIEADLSQEGQAKGHDQRDKDGFARIVEAIQGTVWSSAVVGSATSSTLKANYVSDKAAMEEVTVSVLEEKEETKENIYQPPSLFTPMSSNNNGNTSNIGNETRDKVPAAATSTLVDPTKVGPSNMAQLREDLEAEKFFDKMEGFLKEATQIRAASKNGTMTDNERRERAGEAALALVNLMGQFGMDGDDDDKLEDSDSDDFHDDVVKSN